MVDASDPNDQQVDPLLPQDELEEFIKSLEGGYGENINLSTLLPQGTTAEPTDRPSTDDDEEEPDEEPQDEPVDHFLINGNRFERADIERLYNFDQYMRANPDVAARMAAAAEQPSAGQPPVSEQTPQTPPIEWQAPEPPEGLDLDEPTSRFLWDQQVGLKKQLFDFEQGQKRREQTEAQYRQQQIVRQATADMETALSQFRSAFPMLNDDDIDGIRRDAAQLVPAFIKDDTVDRVAGLKRTMEVAAYANSEWRKKIDNPDTPNPSDAQKSATRKRKASSVAGAPTSAPKVDSRPQYRSDRDMVNEFATALAEQGFGR